MLGIWAVHLVLNNLKARNEERHLLATHGEPYAQYLRRTGRFFPRFAAHSS
jgi:protein-S-isoprenylcysteine O-methyltransferase Ste14